MRHVRLHFAAGYPAAAGASTVAVMLHLGMQRVMHTLLEQLGARVIPQNPSANSTF
jgi:hypothetical protein